MKDVFLDTDPGIDDAMALIYLASCPSVNIRAISTVMGNASLDNCTANALFLKEKFRLTAPIYRGASLCINGKEPHSFPDHVHGKNGLGDVVPINTELCCESHSAHRAMANLALQSPSKITLLAIGQLTNVALAMLAQVSFSKDLNEIILMGGSLNFPGNVTAWAEANIYGDPEAADIVLRSEVPITMVGLDVTMKTRISQKFLKDLTSGLGDLGGFLDQINGFYANYYAKHTEDYDFPMHDSLAAIFLTNPELFITRRGWLSVVKHGNERGKTLFRADEKGPHTVCVDVDVTNALDLFRQKILDKYS